MRAGWVIGATALLILSGARTTWCQEHPNGLYLTSPLSLSSGYDDNFPVASQVVDDNVSILTAPAFAWWRSTHQSIFSIEYQPEFELFSHHPDLNAWNHVANLHFTHQINERLSVTAGDYFLSTEDPTRALSNSLLLLPRGRFFENAFYAGLVYRLDARTKVSFRFDNAYTNATLPGALNGRLDQVSSAGSVTLDHLLSRRHKISAVYSFLHDHPLNESVSGNPTNVNLLSLGYTYDINPGLTIQLAAGGVKGPESAFIGSASIAKRFREMWLLAGYQRYLSFFGGLTPIAGQSPGEIGAANGITPSSIYQVLSFRAWGQLTKRVGLEVSAQRALNGVDRNDKTVKSAIGQLHVHYSLREHLAFFAQVEFYGQNVSQFSPFPESRRRYVAGIEVATGGRLHAEDHSRRRAAPTEERIEAPSVDPVEEDY